LGKILRAGAPPLAASAPAAAGLLDGLNRVLPAQGFSLSELDDAGVDLDLAERLGLPVDAGRIGAYGPNVTVLRDFIRSSRQPL